MSLLEVKELSVKLEDKVILKNLNISLDTGQVSFLLGRNGAGKTTFAQTLMGDSKYTLIHGDIYIQDENNENVEIQSSFIDLKPEDRMKLGLFVSFQNPPEIEGVSLLNFLHTIYVEKFGNEDSLSRSTFKFRKYLLSLLDILKLDASFLDRSLNVGFSGGEKKRCEILQIMLLKPTIVILDEIDSGLDIYALNILQNAVQTLIDQNSTVLYISHNVDFVKKYPNSKIYILESGEITLSGGMEVLDAFIQDKT